MSPSLDIQRQPIAVGGPALPVASDARSAKLQSESGHLPGGARISVGDGTHRKRAKEACESNRRLLSALSLCLKSLFEKIFSWLGLRSSGPARLTQPPARPPTASLQPAPAAPAQRRESVQPAPRLPSASMPAPAPSSVATSEAPPLPAPAAQPPKLPTQAELLAQIQKGVALSAHAAPAVAPIRQDATTQAILARRAQVAGDEDENEDDDGSVESSPTVAPLPAPVSAPQAFMPPPEKRPAAVAPENLLNAIQQGVKLRSGTQQPPASETAKKPQQAGPLAGLPKDVQERLQRHAPVQDNNEADDWDA